MTERNEMTPAGMARQYTEAELQGMADRDLDAAVATLLGESADALPAATSWPGFGRVVEHLRQCGYTVHCYAFEPSHLERLNHIERVNGRRGDKYHPAEVGVIDIHNRLRLGPGELSVTGHADTLPRAAAISAILTWQRKQGTDPVADGLALIRQSAWSEDRRRQQSDRMKRYWERRRAVGACEQEVTSHECGVGAGETGP